MADTTDATANITNGGIEDDSRGPLKADAEDPPWKTKMVEDALKDDAEDKKVMPWKSKIAISIQKSKKVRGGNYVQIATVDGGGLPHCRTVVFRGFMDLPASPATSSQSETPLKVAMKMITDARSEKASQIKNSPACEMVYWFGKTSEQYRISGKLMLISDEDDSKELLIARKQQWGNMSDSAREQFYWQPPGPYSQSITEEHKLPAGGRSDVDGTVLEPPKSFLLMLLVPEKIKYLRLTNNFAQMDTITESGEWVSLRINP
jgi:pyridoxamine 5'-phosphate oxidase